MSETEDRPYHHGDLRRTLIETALAMLSAEQDWTFTLREIARRAEVSHAAPYKHFSDKAALLRELARIGFERLAEAMSVGRAADREMDITARFLATARAYIRFGLDQPGLYRLMFSADADKSVDPALDKAALAAFGQLLDILAEGQAVGRFRALPVGALAAASWAQVHGLTLLTLDGQLTLAKVGVEPVEAALGILLAGLSA